MRLSENRIAVFQEGEPYWRSRGYLPHYEAAEQAQMITYRLHDSLPQAALLKFAEEMEKVSPGKRETERRRCIEEYLDKGAGSCFLSNKSVAQTIEQNLLYFDRKRYILHAWVIMPNHVHILLTPGQDATLSCIIHSWKSYTAKRANSILGRQTAFWQREYFDRRIRNENHFIDAITYIHNNPVKAGLCESPAEWQFSSARFL
jgi:putative DNA methylase